MYGSIIGYVRYIQGYAKREAVPIIQLSFSGSLAHMMVVAPAHICCSHVHSLGHWSKFLAIIFAA